MDDGEIARRAVDLQKRGRDYRLVDIPSYMEWSQRKLDGGESDALIAHLDATSMFLLPEDLPTVTDAEFDELLEGLRAAVEATDEPVVVAGDGWRNALTTRWRTTSSGPFFDLNAPLPEFVKVFPPDLLAAISEFGGREGFLGRLYVRLYRLDELVALNLAYEVPTYLPEIIVFGSDGGGEALALALETSTIVEVPFLPLIAECVQPRARTFGEFVQSAASSGEPPSFDPNTVGKELHDRHPICLGGNPRDPANKVLVPVAKHAEICRFFNKVYRDARSREAGNA